MDSKNFAAKIKAAGPSDGLEEGQFTAYASVFDNIDSFSDIVRKGAFAEDLSLWRESGNPIPLLWGHDMQDMNNNIGHVIEASEDDRGLLVKAQLDTEMPNGATAYRLIKGRRVTDLSFAYDVLDSTPSEVDGKDVTELNKVKLYEVSVVPIGANRETEFLEVKRAARTAEALTVEVKAGRVLSAKNEAMLRTAYDSIGSVLDALATNDDTAKASGTGPAKVDEEPETAKSTEEPSPTPPAMDLLSAQLNLLALT